MKSRHAHADEDLGVSGLALFSQPAPFAHNSPSSKLAAQAIDGPFRSASHRAVMLCLAASSSPLTREEIAERTGRKEASLCARLSELRKLGVVGSSSMTGISSAGVKVDRYELTKLGHERLTRDHRGEVR